jgi:hypothetical protein
VSRHHSECWPGRRDCTHHRLQCKHKIGSSLDTPTAQFKPRLTETHLHERQTQTSVRTQPPPEPGIRHTAGSATLLLSPGRGPRWPAATSATGEVRDTHSTPVAASHWPTKRHSATHPPTTPHALRPSPSDHVCRSAMHDPLWLVSQPMPSPERPVPPEWLPHNTYLRWRQVAGHYTSANGYPRCPFSVLLMLKKCTTMYSTPPGAEDGSRTRPGPRLPHPGDADAGAGARMAGR